MKINPPEAFGWDPEMYYNYYKSLRRAVYDLEFFFRLPVHKIMNFLAEVESQDYFTNGMIMDELVKVLVQCNSVRLNFSTRKEELREFRYGQYKSGNLFVGGVDDVLVVISNLEKEIERVQALVSSRIDPIHQVELSVDGPASV